MVLLEKIGDERVNLKLEVTTMNYAEIYEDITQAFLLLPHLRGRTAQCDWDANQWTNIGIMIANDFTEPIQRKKRKFLLSSRTEIYRVFIQGVR